MVKPDVVGTKLTRAAGWLDSASEALSRPPVEFLSDRMSRDLACFHLFRAIQACIDLAAHLIADAGRESPDNAGAAFDVLRDRRVIDSSLAKKLRQAVGLRDQIAHEYSSVDHTKIRDGYPADIEALRRFLVLVADETGL